MIILKRGIGQERVIGPMQRITSCLYPSKSLDISSPSRYSETLQRTLKELVPEYSVTFIPSDDGSILGAAIVTAVEVKLRNHREGLAQALAPLKLSIVDLERLRNGIRQEMDNGLSKAASKKSCLRMLPTFVCYLPDGSGERRKLGRALYLEREVF